MEQSEKTRPGLRERKKARSRQALADAALQLFMSRGFDAVTVAEIADAAEVSVTTLFSYFPSKEALLFDREAEVDAGLVAVVRDRPAEQDILDAVRDYLLAQAPWDPAVREQYHQFRQLVRTSPALTSYWQTMWTRHADTLAMAIAADRGQDTPDLIARATARWIITAATVAEGEADPAEALTRLLGMIRAGLGNDT